jgi:hypothetical protein
MRAALWATAVYNLGGAILFAFPGSALGQLAGLPASAPISYRALLATFALLFGGMYAWLACQPVIHRPMVAFSAIGKAAVFGVVIALCVSGEAPWRTVLGALGDAGFAAYFAYWLRSSAIA